MSYYYITKLLIVFTLVISSFITADLQAQPQKAMVGDALLNVALEAPESRKQRNYLGINSKTFHISDITATVVLVEIFSMYCPHCQKDAPNMNVFFNLLEKNGPYRDKIKLIGIGVGNSPFEVDFFRKTYTIEFPLFSDPDFNIHKLLGGVRTPYFIGIRRLQDGSSRIFLSEAGGEREPKAFLEQIIKEAKLK